MGAQTGLAPQNHSIVIAMREAYSNCSVGTSSRMFDPATLRWFQFQRGEGRFGARVNSQQK
jgi:hypothetical protein